MESPQSSLSDFIKKLTELCKGYQVEITPYLAHLRIQSLESGDSAWTVRISPEGADKLVIE